VANTLAINLDSVFAITKHTVAQMKKQPRQGAAAGHIVLVSSTSGQRGEAFHVDYSASKGAIISMTKSLSSELVRQSIYVNCVAPGWVDTDMSAGALADAKISAAVLGTIHSAASAPRPKSPAYRLSLHGDGWIHLG